MLPLALTLAALSAQPSVEAEAVRTLLEKVESHYETLRDFDADFTQRYERRLLRKTVEESGRVSMKKPGRMRWEYRVPEEKLFVTDGTRSYFYIPLEKQVVVSHSPEGAMGMEEGSPLELLSGRSRLSERFDVAFSDAPASEGGTVLRLSPRKRREELEDVELEVRESDGRVLRVVVLDVQKNRTEFVFHDVRENLGLPESLFRFTIPSGVEVVVQSPSSSGDAR